MSELFTKEDVAEAWSQAFAATLITIKRPPLLKRVWTRLLNVFGFGKLKPVWIEKNRPSVKIPVDA